jgi:hypothetical protein
MYIRLHTWNLRSLNIRVIDSTSKRIGRAPLRFSGHSAGQMGARVALNKQTVMYIYSSLKEMEKTIITWAKDF